MEFYEEYAALQINGNQVQHVQDAVCTEDTFRLFLNDIPLAQIIASPAQLQELGAGFVVCEGLAPTVSEVRVFGHEVHVRAASRAKIDYELRSSGCIGIRGVPQPVRSALTIDRAQVSLIIREIEAEAWRKTGGVHCSVLFQDGSLVAKSSDIGRHNTLDKVVGYAVLHGLDLANCIVGCTGRQPAGMISKLAHAGIPLVISKAAATDAGILLAERCQITLIGFARGERFTIYSHPERILGIPDHALV